MSWFGKPQQASIRAALTPAPPIVSGTALLLAGTGIGSISTGAVQGPAGKVRGARHEPRGAGASRYALLDRVRGKRWGELPAAPPAGRHTSPVRFVADRARPGNSPARSDRRAARSAHRPGVVIIASASDLLAQLVATSLIYSHVPTCQLDPADLAGVELEWHGTAVTINEQPVSGLLWRTLRCPTVRCTDPTTDAMDPETTASWLAAASFPSMRAVNAYDPAAWRRGAGWSVWKDRLGECGVPVQPPPARHATSPGTPSLVVCGAIVSGPETDCVKAAAEVLESSGVRLATVTSLPDGRVTGVNPQPQVSDRMAARRAAARIANYLAA